MAPSSCEETCPESATPVCACSAGGGANAKPTVKIAVVASHLPCMRIAFLLGSVFGEISIRGSLSGRFLQTTGIYRNPDRPSFRCLRHSETGYPVCSLGAGAFLVIWWGRRRRPFRHQVVLFVREAR